VSDDDWFERALGEDADDSSTGDDAEPEPEPDSDDGERSPDDDAEPEPDSDDEVSSQDGDSEPDRPTETADPSDPESGDAGSASGLGGNSDTADGFGDPDDADGPDGGFADADPYEAGDDEELFDEDFGTAFENAPGGSGGGGSAGSEFGGADQFGGGADDFGGLGDGGDDAGFGMDTGGGFGQSDEPFEETEFDEDFESSIPRVNVGIEGLDSMIQGGVPERSLLTTIGSAGTGKTTFGLQFLHEALEAGENAVFITLEESHDRIVNTATEKGWSFDEYEEAGQLAVIDLDPIEMANSLTSIRNDLPRLVEEFGASRLVLDSVSLLEMMYDDQATRRNEVYDFTRSLKQAGVTTMLTSEASEENSYASRHGIIEYLVDAVFILRYIRSSDDFRETRLAVEIQKIRDANHSREIKPYSITNDGISVYRQANIF